METRKTLALCIPAYNAASYLPRLLESANGQEIPFDEILVYNDCSTDNTSEVARQYGATVVEGDINRGCSTGKNRLAEHATSDWLHFHDADDDLLPNFTRVAHKWMNNPNAPDIVLMHFEYRTADTNELIGEPNFDVKLMQEDPVRFSINNKLVNFCLVKRESFLRIGGFNLNPLVLYNEDRAFYTRATTSGLTLGYEKEVTCINFFYPGSMSAANSARCAAAAYHVWKEVIARTNGRYQPEIAKQLLDNAAVAAAAGDWHTTRLCISEARKLCPSLQPGGSGLFRAFYRIAPYASFYLREIFIRYFTSKRRK